MIEQLGRQHTLMFIAGNDESWGLLPRDVTPRLRLRKPLQVGNLTADETRSLLKAYTAGMPPFSADVAATVYELAGGSPREVIRIAYYAFEEVQGALDRVTKQELLRSANKSGSIADRHQLALAMAEPVLEAFGPVAKDLDVGNGVLLDRLLKVDGQPSLALVVVKATDKLSEIDSARRVQEIRHYLEKTWPSTPLLVVTVGYSSKEIEDLLGKASTVLPFREVSFTGQLQTKALELLSNRGPRLKPHRSQTR
jgi:hypothetical protein